ncbi:glycerophosphoryl diester phosphodiesterase [soil metagenome]
MSDPVGVTRNGHHTFFKWHRARRHASDPVFTARRVLEGMALGASVEVDLVVHGGHGFAVLHDHLSIGRETTGTGPAAALSADVLRALHLRGNDGAPIPDHVMLLEDLCALLQRNPPQPGALLQLDYKEDQGPLAPATIRAFAKSVSPVAGNMILSSGEAESVRLLTEATPGLHVGYDPCHGEAVARLRQTRDFASFAAAAIADSPKAEMIYLAYPIVLAADDAGFDIVAALHAASRRVDAYTVKTADETTRPLVERLLGLRIDQITTDDPEGLAALVGAG